MASKYPYIFHQPKVASVNFVILFHIAFVLNKTTRELIPPVSPRGGSWVSNDWYINLHKQIYKFTHKWVYADATDYILKYKLAKTHRQG